LSDVFVDGDLLGNGCPLPAKVIRPTAQHSFVPAV
jgi:hypothetical protein